MEHGDNQKGHHLIMRAVLMLEGGGSLGAFAAGVWKTLAPLLQRRNVVLHAVAGSSIGAINAAVIARHHAGPQGGAVALERFWRERLATPSFPFTAPASWFAPPIWAGRHLRSLDGFLTGLLIGNRALHVSQPANWSLLGALFRRELPLLDRTLMHRTLEEAVGRYASTNGSGRRTAPLLTVAAVDMQDGKLRLFHSDDEPITPAHLLASTAIPVIYAPVELGGRVYWDGDMTRDSLLPLLLRRLSQQRTVDRSLLIITVTQRPSVPAVLPTSEPQMTFHLLNLLMRGKLDVDEESMSDDRRHAAHRTGFAEALTIRREGQPHDALSREFDYSYERIDELIAQGERQAAKAWDAWLSLSDKAHRRSE